MLSAESESENEVAQSYLTLRYPMDSSPPDSSVHGIFQARALEWGAIAFSRGIFPTQGSNPGLLHCRQMLYHLSHQKSPTEWSAEAFTNISSYRVDSFIII